jgi:hypothetical protein
MSTCKISRTAHVLCAMSAWVLVLAPCYAQIPTGTIWGRVSDPSGGAVANASIAATNEATGQVRKTNAEATGDFSLPQLLPGTYSVSVSSPGFQQAVRSNVAVQVEARVEVDFALTVGAVNETVTVSASGPQVESGSTSLDQTIGSREVLELPLLGRNFVDLASLGPGVTPYIFPQQDAGSSFAGKTLSLNIGGSRGNANSYMVDGVEIKNAFLNTPSVQPSVDAIQEFKVMRGTFSAEYGMAAAVINIVTRSGTNAYHGSLFEFLRNDVLDARNYFSPTRGIYRYNQFGGRAGGPIIHNRTFIFGYYEGLRTSQANPIVSAPPPPAQLTGNFSSLGNAVLDPLSGAAFPGNMIPASRISTVTRNFNAYIPAPQANGLLIVSPAAVDNFDQMGGRVDQSFSDADHLFARYMFSNELRVTPGASPLRGTMGPFAGQNLVLSESHIFGPRTTNSFKLAYNRGILRSRYEEAASNISSALGLTGVSSTALPTVTVTGYGALGAATNVDQGAVANTYQMSNSLSMVRGRHEITVGGSLADRRVQKVSDLFANGAFNFDGRYTTNGVADYVLGMAATAQDQIGRSGANEQSWMYGLFLQDNVRLGTKLTFNLGLRYDYEQPWAEGDHKEGYFDTSYPGGRLVVGRNPADFGITLAPALQGRIVQGNVPPGIMGPNRKNFGPRAGLAYRVAKDTVIRAAFGMFYMDPDGNEFAANFQMPPFSVSQSFTGVPSAPVYWDNLFPGGTTLTGSLSPQGGLPLNGHTPYMMQRMFAIQRLVKSTVFELAYYGNNAANLDSRVGVNQAVLTTPGVLAPLPARRPFPLWSDILGRAFRDRSNYNSLQARAQGSLSGGLTYLFAYTYSKAIDTQSHDGSTTQHQDSYNLNNDRGLSEYDMRHNFTTSLDYDLPFGRGKRFLTNTHPAIDAVAGGWHMNVGTSLFSGLPVNPTAPSTIPNVGAYNLERANCTGIDWRPAHQTRLAFFNPAAVALPQTGTFGTCGRDVLTGPGTQQVNLSASKIFRIGESVRLQTRGDFFNLLNRANFGQPNGSVSDISATGFGTIYSARQPRLVQVSMRLTF